MKESFVHDRNVEALSQTLPFMLSLVEKRKSDAISNQLILVQHPSVFTLGRGNQRALGAKSTVKPLIIPNGLNPTQLTRGGGLTFHDEGQVVGYPIVRLDPGAGFGIDVFLQTLQHYLITVLQTFDADLKFQTDPKATGLWIEGKKVVSIGIAISGWVTFHGFAINLSADLNQFAKINPCGLDASVIGNLNDFTKKQIPTAPLKEKLTHLFPVFFEETAHGQSQKPFGAKNKNSAAERWSSP